MATTAANTTTTKSEKNPRVHELTHEEARTMFDEVAQHYLSMSGDEFLRAWEAGEFDHDPDRPEVIRVAMLRRLVQ